MSSNSNHVIVLLVGAALAFVASSITLVPGELLKQSLQMEQYDSLLAAVQGFYQQSGLAGFYTGYKAVLYRDVPYTMLELTLYEFFKRFAGKVHAGQEDVKDTAASEPSCTDAILAAVVTGAFAAAITNPSDLIKTKMMDGFHDAGCWLFRQPRKHCRGSRATGALLRFHGAGRLDHPLYGSLLANL